MKLYSREDFVGESDIIQRLHSRKKTLNTTLGRFVRMKGRDLSRKYIPESERR